MAFTKILGPGIATDTNVQVGILTATNGIKGIGIYSGGYAVHSGVITALNFIGAGNTFIVHDNRVDISISGSGGGVGLGTPLSDNTDSPLSSIYYTDSILSVGSTITVNPPASGSVAYTQYAEIAISEGADLIVDDGDDFIADVLGLSTEGVRPIPGAGGRIRVDHITNKAGTGAPSLTFGASIPVGYGLTGAGGINISGVVTATAFYGSGAYLTNVISGVEVKQDGTSVGTSITAINFSGATLSTPSAGLTTVTIAKQLTIGMRTGTAVTFSLTGTSFNVSGRSGNISISI